MDNPELPGAGMQNVDAPIAPVEPRFEAIGNGYQRIKLRCLSDCEVDDELDAYVLGIRVGGRPLRGRFRVGEIVDLPIDYLPAVDLPALVGFASRNATVQVAGPFPITSSEMATSLMGPGELRVAQLGIEHGLLRGMAVNRTNGLHVPSMFARINGLVVRTVSVEKPHLLDEGGCAFGFVVQLQPGDLGESGVSVDLHVIGLDAAIASFSYVRPDAADSERRMIELESRLRRLQQFAGLQIAALNTELDRRLQQQQQRIDAFIEFAASLLFDRVARETGDAAPGPAGGGSELGDKARAFRALVAAAGATPAPAPEPEGPPNMIRVAPASHAFSFGWYAVENGDTDFRWMGQTGLVLNPAPHQPVAEVTIFVRHVYGAGAPMVQCFFDTIRADLLVEDCEKPDTARLRLFPAPGQDGAPVFQTLRIESQSVGSPAEDGVGKDERVLSIAISGIVFCYAAPSADGQR